MFKRGYIWRIGDGNDVNIWTDPWVPASLDRKVVTKSGQKGCDTSGPNTYN